MTFYELIEKECLTDGLDYAHRRCNTVRLKEICAEMDAKVATGIACAHKLYGICATCIAEKLSK